MAHPLPSSGIPPGTGPVYNTLSEEAVDQVLLQLNNFFEGYVAVKDFQSAANPGDPTTEIFTQKLFISNESPEDDRFLPALIVKVGNFREYRLDLGNAWEPLPDGGQRYGGSITADVMVTVASLSTLDLDRLMDYLMLAFFIVKVPDLQKKGIILAPNGLSANEMGSVPYTADRSILRKQVVQSVWLQWFFDLIPGTTPNITNIKFRLQTPESLALKLPVVEKQ
jgi:hypothetical protein